jgi:23S rRNA (uridine2552-2'-O)-methyltransferase
VRPGKKKRNDWIRRQASDPFVKRAQREGYRSRAAYKIEEIDQRDRLLRPGMAVVELGAAPGGWSQYVTSRIGGKGCLVAVDLLRMKAISGVQFIEGDFTIPEVRDLIAENLPHGLADLVISDMAPNISGVRDVDEAGFSELYSAIADYCSMALKPGGKLLVKLFQGQEADRFRNDLKSLFMGGQVRKPGASRANSREYYFLATGRRRQ